MVADEVQRKQGHECQGRLKKLFPVQTVGKQQQGGEYRQCPKLDKQGFFARPLGIDGEAAQHQGDNEDSPARNPREREGLVLFVLVFRCFGLDARILQRVGCGKQQRSGGEKVPVCQEAVGFIINRGLEDQNKDCIAQGECAEHLRLALASAERPSRHQSRENDDAAAFCEKQ